MNISYDTDSESCYLQLKKGSVEKTTNPAKHCFLDFDKSGDLLGIEILFIKNQHLEFELLS